MRDSVPSGSYSSVCNVLRQWKSRSMIYIIIYILGAKYRFAQSTDCTAQTTDPYFARQSMDFVRNPWIAHI